MRSLLTTAASAVLLAALATGCGDSGSEASAGEPTASTATTSTTSAAPAGRLTVTDGIEPEALLHCLTGAGLAAELSGSVPFGVDVPVARIEVTGLTDYE